MQILLFYATRFPDRKIRGWNCGINGDSSGGILLLKRDQWDILVHKPTVSTLMLGMNDSGIDYYGADKTGPTIESQRKWPLLGYAKNMEKISQILTAANSKIIYLTPTIYDQTGTQAALNHVGMNDALGICGQYCVKLAEEFHGGLVDFHTPMGRINEEQQKKDPAFTLIGPDRIHPGAEGHLVMAETFLKAQKVGAVVSTMSIDAGNSSIVKQDNCQITNLSAKDGKVSFTSKENSLPFPMTPDEAAKVEPLVPFTADLNQEMLTVANLPAGQYKLSIDGQEVQDCSADDLKNGINLATNANTPQFKQAAAIADLYRKMSGIGSGPMRIIASIKSILFKANVSPDDEAAATKVLQDTIAEYKSKGKTAPHIEMYLKYTPEERKKFETDMDDFWTKIYASNQPVPHTFEISPK
jgi:lysophospholipase L1-like esterase